MHQTLLLNTPNFSFTRLPSTVPVEKIPHDLCPVPQLDTTGRDPYFSDPISCPVWKGRTPERQWVVPGVGTGNHILRGCNVEWTHLVYSRWGAGSPHALLGLSELPWSLPISDDDIKTRLMSSLWWRWAQVINWHWWNWVQQDLMGPMCYLRTVWCGYCF